MAVSKAGTGRYAENTKMTVPESRSEVEALLRGVGGSRLITMDEALEIVVGFTLNGRWFKIVVTVEGSTTDQERRAKWRALLLVLKAKLEAVAQKISTVEEEFLAATVMPDGQTVKEWIEPQLAVAYEKGVQPKMLPDYSRGKHG